MLRPYKIKGKVKSEIKNEIKNTGLKTGHYIEKDQRRSKMPAAPMPPPIHMVTMP